MQIPYTYPIWSYLFTPILGEWATSLSVYDKQKLFHQGSFQWEQGNNPYPCPTRIPAGLVSWLGFFTKQKFSRSLYAFPVGPTPILRLSEGSMQ